jgi:hypothetical protein
MLAEKTWTTKYHSIILQNKKSWKDKVILDMGCHTRIIRLFCTQGNVPCGGQRDVTAYRPAGPAEQLP